jgi:hypothetical protein
MAQKRKLVDLVEMGRQGGLKSRKNMTPEEAKKLAQKAARARWGDKKKGSS